MPPSNQGAKQQPTSIGEFVRKRRRASRLTQTELAELAEVGLRFVVELEKNKPTVRVDRVNAVLRVFGSKLGVVPIERGEGEP